MLRNSESSWTFSKELSRNITGTYEVHFRGVLKKKAPFGPKAKLYLGILRRLLQFRTIRGSAGCGDFRALNDVDWNFEPWINGYMALSSCSVWKLGGISWIELSWSSKQSMAVLQAYVICYDFHYINWTMESNQMICSHSKSLFTNRERQLNLKGIRTLLKRTGARNDAIVILWKGESCEFPVLSWIHFSLASPLVIYHFRLLFAAHSR